MKSMCQVARRNSPSVAALSPTSSCSLTASRIASSSTARSSSASILSLAKSSRACRSAGGRSRLPTWSARKGGFVRLDMAVHSIVGHMVRFEFAPLQLAPAVTGAVLYWLRARKLAARGTPVPAARQWCWYGGLALMVATLVSPLATLSEELFFAHMVEHLLLADLGALLLVLGLTGPILAPLLKELPWLRVIFGHPVVALVLWAANFYVWHLPALYQGAVEHSAVHALQHILFVTFGIGMWMALLGPLPKPAWFGNGAKLGYIVAVRLIQSVLANALLWSSGVLYPRYAAGEAKWHITPT